MFRSGAFQLLRGHDRAGRGIDFIRLAELDLTGNVHSVARCKWYMESIIEEDSSMQRNGLVSVVDYRGEWISSPLQFVRLLKVYPIHAVPVHVVSFHTLYPNSFQYEMIDTIRHVLPGSMRMRNRCHRGSAMEVEYGLRTFGIDVSRQLFREFEPATNANDEYDESIEKEIHRREQVDEEWRRSEAPYCDPKSPIAMFPNSQDIIMGRSKTVATTWPGNILYHKVIQDHVYRYIEAQTIASGRIDKTLIAVEVLSKLHNDHKSRFLSRNDSNWTVIDDSEAQVKISQALRMLAREIVHQKG